MRPVQYPKFAIMAIICVIVFCAFGCNCDDPVEPQATPTPTALSTSAPTPVPTATPKPPTPQSPTPTPMPTVTPQPSCSQAYLTAPARNHNEAQAVNFPVARDAAIAWNLTHCRMTVQVYQQWQLIGATSSANSGIRLNQINYWTPLQFGVIEIKIWDGFSTRQRDNTYVTVP